jgi:hypothetical protein
MVTDEITDVIAEITTAIKAGLHPDTQIEVEIDRIVAEAARSSMILAGRRDGIRSHRSAMTRLKELRAKISQRSRKDASMMTLLSEYSTRMSYQTGLTRRLTHRKMDSRVSWTSRNDN